MSRLRRGRTAVALGAVFLLPSLPLPRAAPVDRVERATAGARAIPYDDVDPFIGTGGEGHTYPGATVPFGMVQVSPETDVRDFHDSFPWAAGYRYGDPTILGFAHTHFSGTEHSDMGDVLLVPTNGPLQLSSWPQAYRL